MENRTRTKANRSITTCIETMYRKLTAKAIIELAAPHTWPASVLPVLLAVALALRFERAFDPGLFLSVLFTAVLLQCAVNTINDYSDFVKGTDTRENSDDPTDASIVYNNLDPVSALLMGVAFLVLAALCGVYAILKAGLLTLLFGGIGAAVVLLYSLGRKPISYLPLGECVSGFVMGGIIPMGSYFVFTGEVRFDILLWSLPLILSIGLILMANNVSDIERDTASGRRTLPILLGRRKAAFLLKTLIVLDFLLIAGLAFWNFPGGLFLLPLTLITLVPPAARLFPAELNPAGRMATMGGILAVHKRLGLGYVLIVLADFIRTLL